MKKVILSLIASTFTLFANNEIYLDQSGGSGTFTIKQDGTTNNLGASTKRSKLTGDAKTLTSITTGTGNEVYLDEVGNSTTTEILITGNANKLDSKVEGDSNNTTIDVTGNNNNVKVKASVAEDVANTVTNSTIDITVDGNTNDLTFSMVDTDSLFNLWNLVGDLNTINSYQQGQTGGVGHSQRVDIFGSSNKVDIYQLGAETNALDLFVIGSDNNYTITQTDGTSATYTNPSAVTGQ